MSFRDTFFYSAIQCTLLILILVERLILTLTPLNLRLNAKIFSVRVCAWNRRRHRRRRLGRSPGAQRELRLRLAGRPHTGRCCSAAADATPCGWKRGLSTWRTQRSLSAAAGFRRHNWRCTCSTFRSARCWRSEHGCCGVCLHHACTHASLKYSLAAG